MLASKSRLTGILVKRGLQVTTARLEAEAPSSKLDELFARVEDFPAHHIGPRRHEAKAMLQELGYDVRNATTYLDRRAYRA
jgi:hypothetical protein